VLRVERLKSRTELHSVASTKSHFTLYLPPSVGQQHDPVEALELVPFSLDQTQANALPASSTEVKVRRAKPRPSLNPRAPLHTNGLDQLSPPDQPHHSRLQGDR
jgi:hypothetical protein